MIINFKSDVSDYINGCKLIFTQAISRLQWFKCYIYIFCDIYNHKRNVNLKTIIYILLKYMKYVNADYTSDYNDL